MSGIQQMFFSKVALSATSLIGILSGTGSDFGFASTIDTSGNLYIAGQSGSSGTNSVQLAKYNSSGIIQWQYGYTISGGNPNAYSITLDSSGNIYVCGKNANPSQSILVIKLNSSGVIQWQKGLAATDSSMFGRGITIDSSGNIYASGYYTISSTGRSYAIVAKYNASGVLQWQKTLYDTTDDRNYSVSIDSSGNIYTCGSSYIINSNGIQIAKYNASGVLQWQHNLRISGGSGSVGYSVMLDSSGNIYLAGSTQGNSIVAKYNSSAVLQWQRTLSGGSSSFFNSCYIDSANNLYLCGGSTVGSAGMQIAKYNASGNIQWQRRITSSGSIEGYAIISDSNTNFYIVGTASNDIIFASLPLDGSKTGVYTVGGFSYTYSASSLTDAAGTLTDSVSSLTGTTTSYTDSALSLTRFTSTLTSTVTTL